MIYDIFLFEILTWKISFRLTFYGKALDTHFKSSVTVFFVNSFNCLSLLTLSSSFRKQIQTSWLINCLRLGFHSLCQFYRVLNFSFKKFYILIKLEKFIVLDCSHLSIYFCVKYTEASTSRSFVICWNRFTFFHR